MQRPQPTFFSKLWTSLLGKKAVMTILDTAEIISYQASKNNIQQLKSLTRKAFTAWNGIIWSSVFSSFFLYYKYFKHVPWYSFSFLRISVPLVVFIFYSGVYLYCKASIEEVSLRKKSYYESFQANFMEHLNTLKFKYEIDQKMQFEGIFNDEQMGKWIDDFFLKTSKTLI